MDFSLSEQQEKLKKTAREFLEKECTEDFIRDMEEDDDGYSPKLWRRIANMGWLSLSFPRKYGGKGSSFLDLAILYEEMGRAMLPGPHLSTLLCGLAILAGGSEEQKAALLPRIAKGELVLALALSEPQASWDGTLWDAEGVTVPATRQGSSYVINGTKLFVPDAHIADYLLCVTRTRTAGKPENGVTLFLVDGKSPGIRYNLLKTTAGDKQCEVIFNKVKVPVRNKVGRLNGGWAPLAKAIQQGAVLVCAEMVGAGQRVLELTVDYANSRIQFDMPIGINQYVQDHCVNLLSYVEGARWVTYEAAWKISEGLPCDMEVAIAKAWTSEGHEKACWYAHQVHAGVGYTSDTGILPLYSRRGKNLRLYLGDTDYYLEKVAQQMEKWPPVEKPEGKPLGLWKIPEDDLEPVWEPWRERWAAIQKRKADRKQKKAQKK
jgi:alkylation response protein AidB-like acyl-CoA dehydrogenase